VGAVAVIAFAACSVLTSFDGLVPQGEGADGGLPDGAPADGTTADGAHGDGRMGDAVADVRGPDGTTGDAGRDAGDAGVDTGPIACDAGLVQCGNGCTSLQTDPQNCNRCGHDCQGGACTAGVCQAVALATMQHQPDQIIAVGSRLFWSNLCCPSGIMACALPNCAGDGGVAASTFLNGTMSPVVAFATDPGASMLYWIDQQSLMSCPVGATCMAPVQMVGNINGSQSQQLVTSATTLYWNEDRSIQSCPFTGCPGSDQPFFQQNNGHMLGLTLGGGTVYWGRDCCPSEVRACPAGAMCTLAQDFAILNNGHVNYLATGGSTVYWTTQNGMGQVMSCPLAGCLASGPTIVATNLPQPRYIVADGAGAYWTDTSARTIDTCQSAACATPAVLWTGNNPPGGIAIDATTVYWTVPNDGLVMKIAKP
jgi:hypothetical protein